MRNTVKWDQISGKFSEQIRIASFAPLSPKTVVASGFQNPGDSQERLLELAGTGNCKTSAATQRLTGDSHGNSRDRLTHAFVHFQPRWQIFRSPGLPRATICHHSIASPNLGYVPDRAPLPQTSTPKRPAASRERVQQQNRQLLVIHLTNTAHLLFRSLFFGVNHKQRLSSHKPTRWTCIWTINDKAPGKNSPDRDTCREFDSWVAETVRQDATILSTV